MHGTSSNMLKKFQNFTYKIAECFLILLESYMSLLNKVLLLQVIVGAMVVIVSKHGRRILLKKHSNTPTLLSFLSPFETYLSAFIHHL